MGMELPDHDDPPHDHKGKLAEGNKLLGAGQELGEVCRHLETAESTWHRWLAQYGGMKANEAKRLKELEAENARSRRLPSSQPGP